ncbi:response regulator [Rossellomorea vietnamensis]|uniref:Response regulator n=1 Tax=Rossellomorea vietnamensis TaxID=218284 RepID=A0A5D4KBZ5_9BACI|nr:response regulator [Rossellomorea vietnamensis]TYR74486.1 response regulator [Rossellomorea vietnamensis]
MFNVMIVDDEPIIRFGLKSSIDWEKENLKLIGDYSNGQQALDAMEREGRVDILITDIKMPVMDGITLMKKALVVNPKLKIVLVSSYNEFEYVREGLTHGAVDYILKPTLEPETFLKTVHKCVDKIEEEQKMDRKLEYAQQSNVAAIRRRVEQEMKRILLKKHDEVKSESVISMFEEPHAIVLLKLKGMDRVDEDFGFLYNSLIFEEIQERFYLATDEGICFLISDSELLFFLKKSSDPLTLTTMIKEKIERETSIGIIYGYDVVHDVQDLVKGYYRAHAACGRYFFHSEKEIFRYRPDIAQDVPALSEQELEGFLLPYEESRSETFIEERFGVWSSENMKPSVIKKEAGNILKTIFMKKIDPPVLMEKIAIIEASDTLEEVRKSTLEGLKACAQLLVNGENKPHMDNELLDKALHYIHAHYTDELTLQNVADHIHISRNYFSILFKRLMDQNFIDYVIELRVKKAKALLRQTSLKVYEVAANAGFNDVKYFSKLFKKVTGQSPGDYRLNHEQ